MKLKNMLCSLLVIVGFKSGLQAQIPCSLDNTFATGGKLVSDGSRLGDEVLIQADGKILIACNPFGNGAAYIKRLKVDGTTDSTYGVNGQCHIAVAEVATRISGMVMVNGQVFLCGNTSTNIGGTNTYPYAAAVTSNGTMLSSFGTNGVKKFPTNYYTSSGIASDNFGNLYICGAYSLTELFVAKLDANGNFVTGFDGDGIARLATGSNDHWFETTDILCDKDANVVVCGKKYRANNGSTIPNYWNMLAVRFLPNGAIDNNFANNGLGLYNSNPAWFDEAKNIHVLPNGDYVLTGDTYDNTDYDYTVLKIKQDGIIDAGWGNAGWQIHDLEFDNEMENPLNSAFLPDGRILVSGNQGSGDTVYFALLMLKADGTRDNSFAPNGFFKHIFNQNNNSSSSGLGIDATGKIVLAGYTRTCANGVCGPLYMAVARYNSSFAPNGLSEVASPSRSVQLYPNPASTGHTVRISSRDGFLPTELKILNSQGQVLYEQEEETPISAFPVPMVPGIYHCILQEGHNRASVNFVVH